MSSYRRPRSGRKSAWKIRFFLLDSRHLQATPGHSRPLKATPGHSRPLQATPGRSRLLKAAQVHSRPLQATQGCSRPLQATPGHSRPNQYGYSKHFIFCARSEFSVKTGKFSNGNPKSSSGPWFDFRSTKTDLITTMNWPWTSKSTKSNKYRGFGLGVRLGQSMLGSKFL